MKFLITNLEAMSLGYVVIPNILFIVYFTQNGRHTEFAWPAILFYVIVKTIPYAVRAFGKIKNPYKILTRSLIIALVGAYLTLFSPTIIEGAILLGIGFASIQPAYQELKDTYKKQKNWSYGKEALYGIFYLIAILALGMCLASISFNYFVIELLVLIILMLYTVHRLSSPWKNNPVFTGPFHFKPLIPTILIFLMILGARVLKQTGDKEVVFMTLTMWIIMLFGFNCLQQKFKASRLWTFWTGAVNNFFLIYSIFYFDALGKFNYLYLAYCLYIFATIGGMILARKIKSSKALLQGCLVGFIISLVPNMWTFLIGLLISCLFCSITNQWVWQRYRQDKEIPALNTRFVKQHYNILGSIASQITLISLLIINNFLFNQNTNQILSAYYNHTIINGMNWPLWITRLGCILLLVTVLSILFVREKLDNND